MTQKSEMPLRRRNFLKVVGASAVPMTLAAGVLAEETSQPAEKPAPFFLAINTSYRPGMTTAAGLEKVLESIRAALPGAKTGLLELSRSADMTAFPPVPSGQKLVAAAPLDPFGLVEETLKNPALAGIILGSPVYNGTMTSLCKYFIERCNPMKKEKVLANKIVGFLSVGGNRNGGQELTLQNMMMSLNGHRLVHADDNAHWGATLWSRDSSIEKDEPGLEMCRQLGIRMAELSGLER